MTIWSILDQVDPALGSCYTRGQVVAMLDEAMRAEAGARLSDWLTAPEAAYEAGVSVRTIWHWVKRGLVETTKTNGGKTRIKRSSLWGQGD